MNLTPEGVRKIQIRALENPSISEIIKEYYIGIEELSKYEGIYGEERKRNQIVEGVNIESFDFSMQKAKLNSQNKYKKHSKEQKVENNSEDYLTEISKLLSELNELDKMLIQTSSEIKNEKDKKRRKKELEAEIKKDERYK